ncbi:MAG: DnaB-like helicase C-terminal domain-containing protein [Eubacteriales bacterium]|nr:DnaB-like helicase C-terminal domain-containing protein [Eubacteriales bacterium]
MADVIDTRRAAWDAAQASVIGALLIWPEETAGMIFQQARASYFGTASYRHVFEAAHGLWENRKPIDVVTVLAAAGDEYKQTMADCMEATPTGTNLQEYLHILRDEARLSALQDAAAGIVWAHSEAEAVAAYEECGRLLRDTDMIEDLSWTDLISDYLDRMNSQEPADYLDWGIKPLNDVMFVSPGKFVVLAADSSVGKTALALQLAYHIAATGKKVLFFSLETDKESLEDRLMAEKQVAGIDMNRTKLRALTTEDYLRATDAGQRSNSIPLRVIRHADSIAQIRNRTVMHKADVIFIDYLQIIEESGERRWDVVTKISMALHRMAQQLGTVVVALSQVTPPDSGSLTMNDLRESKQIKHDADFVLMMENDNTFPSARKLTIAKNKDGKRNQRLLLSFDPVHMTFSPAKRKEPSEVPGQGAPMFDLDDDEGGENPFEQLPL